MPDKPLISFDYAIKYLLKSKGDYDIIEGFISALFAAQGYPAVKINALLESESNKETADLKKSIADLVVEDAEGNKYIVEIERAYTPNFMHKACFNSSRLVVDGIYGNQDYTTIKKVFHISLLYFATKNMQKPIYHGKTIIHEIDTAHPVNIRVANQGLVIFDTPNLFPEYFFLSVPMFNDVISQEIDEWLYVMKHSETKKDFKSPYMQKVEERLSVLKMSNEERKIYYHYLKEAVHSQDILTAALEKGRAEGIAKGEAKGKVEGKVEGKAEGKVEVATNMLKAKLEDSLIASVTGLSIDEILKIKDKL